MKIKNFKKISEGGYNNVYRVVIVEGDMMNKEDLEHILRKINDANLLPDFETVDKMIKLLIKIRDSMEKKDKQTSKGYAEDTDSYQLAKLLLDLIFKQYPNFQKKRFEQPGHTEKTLQQWAYHVDLMIRRDGRDPMDIAEVIGWAQRDAFWWKNILSTDKLRKQYDRLVIEMESSSSVKPVDISGVPDPGLTEKLIKGYASTIGAKKEYKLLAVDLPKFTEAVERMKKFYGPRKIIESCWIGYLLDCLEEAYVNSGIFLHPGHLCSDTTWTKLMPQFLLELGIVE